MAGRGVSGKAPFNGAARACSPAAPQPLSACRPPPPGAPRAVAGHAQPGLPARPPAWRGTARRAAGLRSAQGWRTDTRSREAGGPSVRPGGGVRRRLEGAGAAEWTAPPPPPRAWGLLSTSGPWSGDREVGAARGGRRWEGAPWRPGLGTGGRGRTLPDPAGQCTWGVKPRLRVSSSTFPPPLIPCHRRGQSHKSRAFRPGLPPGPLFPLRPPPQLPACLGLGKEEAGWGRDGVERRGKAGDFSLDGPCPSPSVPHSPRPHGGKTISHFRDLSAALEASPGDKPPNIWDGSYPPCSIIRNPGLNTPLKQP